MTDADPIGSQTKCAQRSRCAAGRFPETAQIRRGQPINQSCHGHLHPDRHRTPSEASPLTAEVQLTLGAEVCGRGQHKYAAPCAGSRFTRLAPSLCCPDRPHCAEIPTHQSQAGRPTRHGCLMHQGLEQDVVQNPGCTNAATTSTKTQDQRPSLEHKGSLGLTS